MQSNSATKADEKKATGPKPTPAELVGRRAYSIDEFGIISGLGRTNLYEAVSSNQLVARKFGKRTLILAGDGERFLRSLPTVAR